MDEFNLIKKYFLPLAGQYEGSLKLADDAALIAPPPGKDIVVTKDAITEGVHFLGDEDASLVARKLLRVNLSDLAAMGATPLCYFLGVMLPRDIGEEWIRHFALGLKEDQLRYSIALAGGDTVATLGAVSLSLTAMGTVEKGMALKRSGAQAGDAVYVSGTLGDSALGLKLLQGRLDAPEAVREFLEHRYFLPEPHIALGHKLLGIATSCMDVSDGLLQDLGHICEASGVAAKVHRHLLPRSKAAQALLDMDHSLWDAVTGGGDDYQLLFTVPPGRESMMHSIAHELELPLSKIGVIEKGQGVTLLDGSGKPMPAAAGFRHF